MKRVLQSLVVFPMVAILCMGMVTPRVSAEKEHQNPGMSGYSFDQLDLSYVYNITERLSTIIFTEYNESNGEIAKGRAFGTKGEQKAGEIIYENLTTLGLYTYMEKITATTGYPRLTHEMEVTEVSVKINGKKADAYITPIWVKTKENNYEVNHTYSYENLRVIRPPLIPAVYMLKQKLSGKLEPFVVILQDRAFYPKHPFSSFPRLDNFYFNYYVVRQMQGATPLLYSYLWNPFLTYCKGIILYDFNKDVHDMNLLKHLNHIPFIYINNTDGHTILEDLTSTRVDFTLGQRYNTTVDSWNVIGQINGTDPSKTVIVCSMLDSWWCQGTADSAISMAMVLGVAKYFKEQQITPKYTLKFIGFCGEEHGSYMGARYYSSTHEDEDIVAMVDLNQIGYKQETSPLTLNVIGNNLGLLDETSQLLQNANYTDRVNSSKDLQYVWMKQGIVSNPSPFQLSHPKCEILCFLKDGGWVLHHRDGLNHTEGDVLKYFDPQDVNVTGEMVLNVIKYLANDI
ncbi:MAG: putative aminopeptidase [Thermoplasmatales archaeon]|nr:putative aminopeptidase [Thermoplasmatales archaeon]